MTAQTTPAARGRARALGSALFAGLITASAAVAQDAGTGPALDLITATVDVTRTGAPIDPLLYGYFIENLGSIFEGGLWAEKLGDRKFFHAVTNDSALTPPNSRSRWVPRWWPVGPEGAVRMDSARAWVGKHSPRVALDPGSARGIRQPGIPVSEGRRYTGRVVLAADAGARVRVSLVWGSGPEDRETVEIEPTADYATYPLDLTAGATNDEATLEIVGTGTGSFWIGAVSLMRADNIEGFRPDLIEVLRRVNPTMTRWGGNFSAGYEWRDGIGDRDRRPPRYDYAWNAVEQNDVGTFEVLALNRLLGSEPNIGVNSGLGDAHSAAQWVEYVNGGPETPMGALRAEHGHPEPFGVRWWGIGNEMYGQWQLGHMAINHYVLQHNRFAEAMRAVDPSIILVASGATPFETGTTERHHRPPLRQRPFLYGSAGDWSGQLLEHSWRNFDFLAEHIYAVTDAAFDRQRQEFVPIHAPLEDRLRRIANRVEAAVEAWEHYRATMPWLEGSGIRMVLDEWAAGGWRTGDIAGALGAALVLHEMFRHSDVWAMSAYTALTSVVAYDRTDAYPTIRSAGLLFELYTEHLGTVPVEVVQGSSPQPDLPGTVGVDKPAESSGSPTYPLDVLAALSEDGRTLTVAVANPSEAPHALRLHFQGATPKPGRVWTLSSPRLDAQAVPGQEPVSAVTEAALPEPAGSLTVPAATVQLYELPLQ